MNTLDILKYGHLTLVGSLENVPFEDWETDGVCGVWSVKDIVAHLASYEQWHLEVLNEILGNSAPTPIIRSRGEHGDRFNDVEVEKRRGRSPQEMLDEYKASQAAVMELVCELPGSKLVENGTLPWYGAEYCLNDFFVYTSYGHKREHSAQVNVYRDQLEG
jgi:hypothetical protein